MTIAQGRVVTQAIGVAKEVFERIFKRHSIDLRQPMSPGAERDRATPRSDTTPASSLPSVLGGRLIIGVEVGRSMISYGALAVSWVRDRQPQLGTVDIEEAVETRSTPLRKHESSDDLYADMISAITEVFVAVEELDGNRAVDGIAISTPSWIDIRTKTLASPVGPFPVSEALAEGVANRLWSSHLDLVRRVVRRDGVPPGGPQALAALIYLDTDSRSVIRYDRHMRVQQGISWQNYACILVVEGVGAGLILNGGVYYGSHSSEGEVGHMTVHLSPQFNIGDGRASTIVETSRCDCQLPGMHWETLSGTAGFLNMARSLDRGRFVKLSTVYKRPLTYTDLIDVAAFARNGVDSSDLSMAVAEHVVRDRENYRRYCQRLLHEYARIMTLGIANMANILDIDHVVIGGPIVKYLDKVEFRNEIRSFWDEFVLRGQRVSHSFDLPDCLWQGAALLFWDPRYCEQVR